jgi:hypothetical protein
MDFLPPKPPRLAGADRDSKKKGILAGDSSPGKPKAKGSPPSGGSGRKSSRDSRESSAPGASADDSLPSFSVPDIAPVEEDSIEEKLSGASAAPEAAPEKKKGFFGKLFGPKRKDDGEMRSELLGGSGAEASKKDEEVNSLRQALGMEDPSRKIALHEIEKTPDYVPRTSWDSEIVDISVYRKQDYRQDAYKRKGADKAVDKAIEKAVAEKYQKKEAGPAGAGVKPSAAKKEAPKAATLKTAPQKAAEAKPAGAKPVAVKAAEPKAPAPAAKPVAAKASGDWVSDVAVEKITPAKGSGWTEDSPPAAAPQKKTEKKEPGRSVPEEKGALELPKLLPQKAAAAPQKEAVRAREAAPAAPAVRPVQAKLPPAPQKELFPGVNADWQKKVAALLGSSKLKDAKSLSIFESKLKKALKASDSSFSKLVAGKKKGLAADLKRLAEKQAALSAREARLRERDAALTKKKQEIDGLAGREEDFRKKKEAYEKEFEGYKKGLVSLKGDMLNAQKSYEYERKDFNVKRRDLQVELKKLQNTMTYERRKGEARLGALAKEVEQAQAKLSQFQETTKKAMDALKAKEREVQERERKVTALLDQEKRILFALRMDSGTRQAIRESPEVSSGVDSAEEMAFTDGGDRLGQKILDCRDLLREENYEDAKVLYNELREEFTGLQLDDEKKKSLRQELRELYDEICTGIVSVR